MGSCNAAVNKKINELLQILAEDSNDYYDTDVDQSVATNNGDTILHLALKKEDFSESQVFEILEIFLDLKIDPNVRNKKGEAPLHLAIDKEYRSAINILLEHGADINLRDESGNSIAHYLIENQWAKFQRIPLTLEILSVDQLNLCVARIGNFIDWLVTKGLIIDCKNNTGMTPIALAMQLRFYWILPTLLRHLNDGTYVNERGQNLLHLFVEKLSHKHEWVEELINRDRLRENNIYKVQAYVVPTIQILSARGVMNIVDKSVYRTLHFDALDKVQEYVVPTIQILLAKGVSVDGVDKSGYTALHLAALDKNLEAIELMLPRFTKVNARDTERNTVLHIIAGGDFTPDVVRTLISKGAKLWSKNKSGKTPLQIAVEHGQLSTIEVMKEHGADFSLMHKDLGNLLHIYVNGDACSTSQEFVDKMIKLLVAEGCDVNARNPKGTTPLHLACERTNRKLVKSLLSHEADVHIRELSEHQYTPLHEAAQAGNEEIIEMLIKAGADVNARTALGRTPLHLTLKDNREEEVELILRSGALVDVRDDEGWLPLRNAIESGDAENISKMLDFGANINDPDIVRQIDDMVYNNKSVIGVVLEHWYKLKIAGLPAMKEFEDFVYYSREFDQLQIDCLEEVEMLKSCFIDGRVSCYDFLHMDLNRSCSYAQKKEVQKFVKSKKLVQKFPNYSSVIMAAYRRSIVRKPMLAPARAAWYTLTNIQLPVICVDIIIAHLENSDLRVMIEAE